MLRVTEEPLEASGKAEVWRCIVWGRDLWEVLFGCPFSPNRRMNLGWNGIARAVSGFSRARLAYSGAG